MSFFNIQSVDNLPRCVCAFGLFTLYIPKTAASTPRAYRLGCNDDPFRLSNSLLLKLFVHSLMLLVNGAHPNPSSDVIICFATAQSEGHPITRGFLVSVCP